MNLKEVNLYLLANYPYYYALLQQSRILFTQDEKYLAYVKVQTNIEITINPERLSKLSVAEQAGILIHELQHVFRDHIKQSQAGAVEGISNKMGIQPNHMLANIAMDMEINPGVRELRNSPTLGEQVKATESSGGCVFPSTFKMQNGDSWYNYFARIAKDAPKQSGGSGQGEPKDKDGQGGHQDHEYFKESTKDQKMHDEIAANAAKRAKSLSAGQTPQEIEKFLLNYEASKKVPWNLLLRQFMQSLYDVKTFNTWKKVNRRFRGKLPGVKRLPKLDILIGIDSSGSVSDEDLKLFYAEVEAINQTGMANIEIAVFDTVIHQREEYKKGFQAKRDCAGGTNFVCVHDVAVAERVKGVIFLSDGYAEFPNKDEVTYKCLWVLNSDVNPPFGNVVRIK